MTPAVTRLRRVAVVASLAAVIAAPVAAQQRLTGDALYRMTLLRAAPGQLPELVKAVRSNVPTQALVVRHSQGDQWDLLVLVPVESYAKHFGSGVTPLAAPASIAWQEDEFVRGPDLSKIDNFASAKLIHVEMFNALPGKVPELVKEREMENAYLAAVGRPATAIFQRELGASWDVFTLGPYRDWRHYAERDLIAPDRANAAAKAAGFASDEAIGPYMRSLINTHHDTLGTVVR